MIWTRTHEPARFGDHLSQTQVVLSNVQTHKLLPRDHCFRFGVQASCSPTIFLLIASAAMNDWLMASAFRSISTAAWPGSYWATCLTASDHGCRNRCRGEAAFFADCCLRGSQERSNGILPSTRG